VGRYSKIGAVSFVLIATLGILPFTIPGFWLHIVIWTLWYILVGVVINLQIGFSGQLSLLFPAFIGLGAYTTTALNIYAGVTPWLGMIAGGLLAALLGVFTAWLAFRTNLPHLSFVIFTMAICFITEYIIRLIPFLGGVYGMAIPPLGNAPLYFQWENKTGYYFVILLLTMIVVFISRKLLMSKSGLYLRAMRDNEQAAASVGINLLKYKLFINALCGFLCAWAGTFYVQYVLYVDPHTVLTVVLVIEVIVFIAVGGLGTLWGPVVGCSLLVPIGEILRSQLGGKFPGLHLALFGLLLILVMEFFPHGIVGWFEHRKRQVNSALSGAQSEEPSRVPLLHTYLSKLKIRVQR